MSADPVTLPLIETRLEAGERVVARFQTDLDRQLQFRKGLLVLTNRRLLHLEENPGAAAPFQDWPLGEISGLSLEEMGATGALHLTTSARPRGVRWRFTAGYIREADAFVARFMTQRRAPDVATADATRGTAGEDGGEERLGFTDLMPEAARGNPLLRLLMFSRPWLGLIALGLGLTIAATSVSLLSPWITGSSS